MENIEIIGAGYIGLPLAAAFSRYCSVILVEKDDIRLKKLREGTFIYGEKDVDELLCLNAARIRFESKPLPCANVIVAVQTPTYENGSPDVSYVQNAVDDILPLMDKESLLVLESTVPVGTCKAIKEHVDAKGYQGHFAYCPETILPGNVLAEIRGNARVIGSDDEVALFLAKNLYRQITGADIDVCGFEEAELVKLLQNASRDVNLAFANQVAAIAIKEGVDPFSLIEKINKHPRVQVLRPGSGVGGHCIAVDPLFLIDRYGENASLLRTARFINDQKPRDVAKEAEGLCEDLEDTICVLGLAYKPDIGDVRNSSGLAICRRLMEDGYSVIGCEPNAALPVIAGVMNLSIEEALARAKVFVIAQGHRAFLPYRSQIKERAHVDPCGFLR